MLSGLRLAKVQNCPEELYNLMLQCWSHEPAQRPNFQEILDTLLRIQTPKEQPSQEKSVETYIDYVVDPLDEYERTTPIVGMSLPLDN